MLDLAWLAMRHALRDRSERLYAIDIPDERDGVTHAVLQRDRQPCLEWRIEHGIITTPGPFEGRNPLRSFTSWAIQALEGGVLEAALALQKGYFVAGARRFVLPAGRLPASDRVELAGVCFGYGTERIASAERREPGRRDFTDHPERLLKFL